jgi:nitrate/TMAO reductase-like tetraheme cytochrome c subunit
MSERRRLAALLLAGLVLACRPVVPFAERTFFSTESRALPAAADCERCHQEVYREWKDSGHARAWSSEGFQAATHAGRAEPCTGCHAPAPLVQGELPALRGERRSEGVTCTSCHLSTAQGAAPLTMRGPASRSLPVEVHPVVAEDPLYRSSELCGGCHQATFAEWKAAPPPAEGERETCQGCHMPRVHRTVESVNEAVPYSALLVAMEDAQDLRRHRFAVPDRSDEELVVSLARSGDTLTVHVENRLPHALPTGSFGRREVRLLAAWPGGSREVAFAARPGDALAPGASRSVQVPLDASARGAAVVASLRRFDPASRTWHELARAEAPPARPPGG